MGDEGGPGRRFQIRGKLGVCVCETFIPFAMEAAMAQVEKHCVSGEACTPRDRAHTHRPRSLVAATELEGYADCVDRHPSNWNAACTAKKAELNACAAK